MQNENSSSRSKRVALFAEAVTLAHVARLLALGRALDAEHYDVTFVTDRRYADLLADSPWPVRWIDSIPASRFSESLARGGPVYDERTLQRYVDDDLAVISDVKPDLVVGDFRLSLSVSARVARVPYAAIANAYWSPCAVQRYPIPDHPLVAWVGVAWAQRLFDIARPLIFAYHARPLNRVRRSRGLPSLGRDLRRTYTDADWVFYADPPELVPIDRLPPNHQYLGPVLWSPDVELPAWWEEVPQDKPVVYVTMGSSGSGVDLVTALESLEDIGCTAIVATAGDSLAHVASTQKFAAKYLPGEAAARRARLVVCNGGAPTCHQALAAGVPVLGIARNLDQHLNMQAVERAGVGMLLRSDACSAAAIRDAVRHLLDTPSFNERAARMSDAFRRYDAPSAFASATARLLAREGRGA